MLHSTNAVPRIGIVVVAYNAESTLRQTLDRIPVDYRSRVAEVIICDDASSDSTFEHGRDWAARSDTPATTVIRHTKNLGYGGNQKAAYALAIAHGLDIVVLLHADGQYAPESLPQIIDPFLTTNCAAVFGSRMMDKGAAKSGGMPFYKRLGNRVLTRFENGVLGTDLTEFHSGYRAYRTSVLKAIPFQANSDGFDFDTQIIAQVVHAGGTITEVSIPTYYGDEICYINGMKYAKDVVRDVLEYRLAVQGFGTSEWVPTPDEYAFKEGDGSSHSLILQMMATMPPSKVLDLGCSAGCWRTGSGRLVTPSSVSTPSSCPGCVSARTRSSSPTSRNRWRPRSAPASTSSSPVTSSSTWLARATRSGKCVGYSAPVGS